MLESRLCRETLAAAEAFHARKLWLQYDGNECFAVVVPGEEYPLFASIMGQAGEEFGLTLFRGPNACWDLSDLLVRDPQDVGRLDEAAIIGFSMGPFAEAPPFGRSFLAKARFAGSRSSIVPCFLAKDAGREPRKLTSEEVRTCLYVLRGVLKAVDAGMLEPGPLRPGQETLTLVIGGDPLDPEVSCELRRFSRAPGSTRARLAVPAGDLSSLPRLPSRWLLGFPVLPVSIEGDDRTVRVVLIADGDSELMVEAKPIQGGVAEAVEVVCEAFRGHNALEVKGLPREVAVANRELFNALCPMLDSLGVPCRYEPGIRLLDGILEHFVGGLSSDGLESEEDTGDPDAVPAADDLRGWKLCDQRLYHRAQAWLADAGGASDRAVARYFGGAEAGDPFLHDRVDMFPGMSFFEWCWLDYRATRRSKTLAEKMLAAELPRAERILLEARLSATPSMYRVDSVKKGEWVELVDVLFGGEVVVHDTALSGSATRDMCFPGRVFPAGEFHFVSPLGPPLSPFEVGDALEFLGDEGLELTQRGTKARAHLFGRLWAWSEQRRARTSRPHVVNTDGDDMCVHTTTYLVGDEAEARKAISAREDIDWDDEETSCTWVRRKHRGPGPALGDALSLGTLTFIGDELLVEVSSAERLRKARAWLDKIPGIEFQAVRSRTLDELLEADVPPDDRIGAQEEVPMTPDLAAHLQEFFRRHYMDWLDSALPVFNGKTPRETCRTAEGRKKVARMIRATPRPVGSPGVTVDVPRAAMLKALGLTDEA